MRKKEIREYKVEYFYFRYRNKKLIFHQFIHIFISSKVSCVNPLKDIVLMNYISKYAVSTSVNKQNK